jgi:hypothetical protein
MDATTADQSAKMLYLGRWALGGLLAGVVLAVAWTACGF